MALFDDPTGSSLFGPDVKRQAALQGLFAMGNRIGEASQPSALPRQPFALAGGAAALAYDEFLQRALKMSLIQEQLKGGELDRKAKERKELLIQQLFSGMMPGNPPPQSAIQQPGAMPGAMPGAPPGPTPAMPQTENNIFNDTPQNRMLLQLGIGVDPSKIYSAPTTKMMPAAGSGLPVEHEYRGGKWVAVTGQPQAPADYSFTPEGSLAPLAGGPQDPRTIQGKAYATEAGQAPFKGYPVPQGGRLEFPFRNSGGGGAAGGAGGAGGSPGMPAAQGPYWQSRPGGGMTFGNSDELGKTTKDKVEGDLLKSAGQLAEFGQIRAAFKPEFHQWLPQAANAWTALKEKANLPGFQPKPEEKAALASYSTYLADTGRSMSKIRNELFGAALSGVEAKKAEQFLVEGNESPTQAKAKIDGFYDMARKAVARLHYVNRSGMGINGVALDNMPKIIQQRGDALASQFKTQGLQGEALTQAVKRQIGAEFGLLVD